jgi:hypothetical protein
MTVKIYVAHDADGHEWAPDRPHEVGACEWMVKKAWDEFHNLEELYVILLNHQPRPRADMVVIRERGLGVLELKHYPDEIHIRWDGSWTYGEANKKIKAADYDNPRVQVLSYAKALRTWLVPEILPPSFRQDRKPRSEFKFQTGVCFTNHLAMLEQARDYVNANPPPDLEPWEDPFSVFGIDTFTAWVRELRFEGQDKNQPPIRLTPGQIINTATFTLGMVEWTEVYSAIMSGHPFGTLTLDDGQGKQVYNLLRDQTLIGRRHSCEIVIPERYSRVSKEHCVIEKKGREVFLIDKSSRNGTLLRNQRIRSGSPVCLRDGDVIRLGGSNTSDHACTLTFNLVNKWEATLVTEDGSHII